jgi:hypothetical protein
VQVEIPEGHHLLLQLRALLLLQTARTTRLMRAKSHVNCRCNDTSSAHAGAQQHRMNVSSRLQVQVASRRYVQSRTMDLQWGRC